MMLILSLHCIRQIQYASAHHDTHLLLATLPTLRVKAADAVSVHRQGLWSHLLAWRITGVVLTQQMLFLSVGKQGVLR